MRAKTVPCTARWMAAVLSGLLLCASPFNLCAADALTVAVIDEDGSAGRVGAPASAAITLPDDFRKSAKPGRLCLTEMSDDGTAKPGPIPAQFEPNPVNPDEGTLRWLMPPGTAGKRRFRLGKSRGQTTPGMIIRYDENLGVADVFDAAGPVLRYNHGATSPPEGIGKEYARGDYIHPLHGPDGETLTDDYPKDHPHHRGLNWSWATILQRGEMRDAFAVRGIWARPVRPASTASGPIAATIEAESEWKWNDKEATVNEQVVIRAFRQVNRCRCVDFEIRLRALVDGLQFCGRLKREYSGFNLRMAPAEGQQIVTHTDPADAAVRRAWADYSAAFPGGKGRAGVAIIQCESNPLHPSKWLQYDKLNFFQPAYPGGEPIPMPKDKTIVLRYRLWIHPQAATEETLSDVWTAYNRPPRDAARLNVPLTPGPYADILTYEYVQSRAALVAIEQDISRTAPAQHEAIEAKLLATLKSPEATPGCKEFVCRMLQVVGSTKCVPALAELLSDEKLSHMARYAMERLPGPEVDNALLKALDRVGGELRIGIINTLGDRASQQAVRPLATLALDRDAPTARATIAALGRIGGTDAAMVLKLLYVLSDALQATHSDACLLCADKMLAEGKTAEAVAVYREMFGEGSAMRFRIAALRGIVRAEKERAIPTLLACLKDGDERLRLAASRFILEIPPGTEATTGLATQSSALPPAAQMLLLNALAARGDKAAAPEIAKAAESKDEAVRIAAFQALGVLGDASLIGLFAKAAAEEGNTGKTAFDSLCGLKGDEVDRALLAQMSGAEAKVRGVLIRALAARRCVGAVPALLKSAEEPDAAVRGEALKALGALADEKALPSLIQLLVRTKDNADRKAAESAAAAVCKRLSDTRQGTQCVLDALPGADAAARCSLLRVLSALGGDIALRTVVADTKSADAAIKDAAVRALADWPDAGAAPELLNIVRGSDNLTHQVLALRGCIRIVGASALPPERKTQIYRDTMAAARRPEEKKLVLAGLARERSIESLQVVGSCLDDESLRTEAALAAMTIACPRDQRDPGLAGHEVVAVLRKVIPIFADPKIREQVTEHLIRIMPDDLNLARQKPVKSSVGHQGDHRPELAVDGKTDLGSSWWGPNTPSWLEIDLGKPVAISGAQIIFYWDGARYYQYTLDASLDGKAWQTVADGSKNTTPGAPKGFVHLFAPVQARYVRVNVLKNSVNPGAHIVEVKLFSQ